MDEISGEVERSDMRTNDEGEGSIAFKRCIWDGVKRTMVMNHEILQLDD